VLGLCSFATPHEHAHSCIAAVQVRGPRFPGFLEAIAEGWCCTLLNADAWRVLDYKLCNTAKSLKCWSSKYVGSVHLQLVVAKEVMFKMDQAQDTRVLSSDERLLQNELKMKCFGQVSLCRTITRQHSRLTFLPKGDANTRFFHLQACHRSRKSTISHLMHQGVPIVDEESKAQAIFQHFDQILGSMVPRTHGIDMDSIRLPRGQVPILDQYFSEEEVWSTIKAMPLDKAPGLDGFTGRFFQAVWPIIKRDVLQVLAAI
jgi:hypothetical protein